MAKIDQIDRKSAKVLGERAVALLKALGEEYGLEVSYGGGSFSPAEFKCRVSFKLRVVGGVPAAEAAFKRDCGAFGLKPEHFGAEFDMPKGRAKIVGLQPSRTKRPIVFAYLAEPEKRYLLEDGYTRKLLGCQYAWEKKS